jgi:hypothetical protein
MAISGTHPTPSSHPAWLSDRWTARFGKAEADALMAWNDTPPPLILQAARWSEEELEACWAQAGIDVHPAPYGAGLFTDRRRPEELPGYAEGAFVVQDPAQALVARYWDIPEGAVVFDACARPGARRSRRGIAPALSWPPTAASPGFGGCAATCIEPEAAGNTRCSRMPGTRQSGQWQ